jgi:hypothetical protein
MTFRSERAHTFFKRTAARIRANPDGKRLGPIVNVLDDGGDGAVSRWVTVAVAAVASVVPLASKLVPPRNAAQTSKLVLANAAAVPAKTEVLEGSRIGDGHAVINHK